MSQLKVQKSKIYRWLLPVTLVLSLFAFSGTYTPPAAKQPKTLTEQVDQASTTSKRSISFKSICGKLISAHHAEVINTQIIKHHTAVAKNLIRQQANFHPDYSTFLILPHQLTLRCSDEENFISHKG